jgi:hypothetical protein
MRPGGAAPTDCGHKPFALFAYLWVAVEVTLHRTARIGIRATKTQRRRLFGLLRSDGDVRALVLDCNRQLREWKLPPVVTYQELCREIAGMSFGELDSLSKSRPMGAENAQTFIEQRYGPPIRPVRSVGPRSVIRRYSQVWFEAAKRRKAGQQVGFPRRKSPPGGAVISRHVQHRRRPAGEDLRTCVSLKGTKASGQGTTGSAAGAAPCPPRRRRAPRSGRRTPAT